jgi:hypothetical protein
LATADLPPVVDGHADTSTYGVLYGNTGDVISSWITGPSAWEDRGSTQKFVATIRLESLERPPVLARYYFVFSGVNGERWVRAVFDAPSTWTYAFGTLNGTQFVTDGDSTGSVNTTEGTISIDIPPQTLPARPVDGTALDLTVGMARSYLRVPNPQTGGGSLYLVDEALPECSVTLYEAAPATP